MPKPRISHSTGKNFSHSGIRSPRPLRSLSYECSNLTTFFKIKNVNYHASDVSGLFWEQKPLILSSITIQWNSESRRLQLAYLTISAPVTELGSIGSYIRCRCCSFHHKMLLNWAKLITINQNMEQFATVKVRFAYITSSDQGARQFFNISAYTFPFLQCRRF